MHKIFTSTLFTTHKTGNNMNCPFSVWLITVVSNRVATKNNHDDYNMEECLQNCVFTDVNYVKYT